VGGAELLARDFALRSQGHPVVFVCLDALGAMGSDMRQAGFPVAVMNRRPGFDWQCVRQMAKFFRQQNVGLVHAHQYAPFFYSALPRIGGWKYPILFTEHGRDFPDYRRRKRVWANKLLLARDDRVIAVGQCVKEALIQYEGLHRDRVDVIYNGVDTARFNPLRPCRQRIRNELGVTDGTICIAQVARLNRLKDFATAVRSIAILRQSFRDFRYFIVGDGEERLSIERMIDQHQMRQHVMLLGNRKDIPQLLEAMDVFMLTSITEGIPLTLIEAMLGGVPCVATKVGGVPEVILDEVTGLLVAAGQPSELASKLLLLIQSQEMRRRIGAKGRDLALQCFNAQHMHEDYRRLYGSMIVNYARSLVEPSRSVFSWIPSYEKSKF
jgi:glycosyltransferase involved in cell wall biosynthesis